MGRFDEMMKEFQSALPVNGRLSSNDSTVTNRMLVTTDIVSILTAVNKGMEILKEEIKQEIMSEERRNIS